MRRIAEEVLQFDPDLLVLATCNNEGPPRPGYVREQLHKLGGYRLLVGLVAPPVDAGERPRFTPQLLDPEDVREQFEENVRAVVAAASARGVPVALATLPLHLRYDGEGAPLPLEDRGGAHLEEDCVAEGRALVGAGRIDEGLSALARCDDIPDAARWSGFALAAAGRVEEAREALELSVELLPLNRCRPSLNAVNRRIAQESPGAFLVDFALAAEGLSPQGLPGPELFVDYCHLNWRGYAAMTRVLVERLEERGLIPSRPGPTVDEEATAEAWGLEPLPSLGEP